MSIFVRVLLVLTPEEVDYELAVDVDAQLSVVVLEAVLETLSEQLPHWLKAPRLLTETFHKWHDDQTVCTPSRHVCGSILSYLTICDELNSKFSQ